MAVAVTWLSQVLAATVNAASQGSTPTQFPYLGIDVPQHTQWGQRCKGTCQLCRPAFAGERKQGSQWMRPQDTAGTLLDSAKAAAANTVWDKSVSVVNLKWAPVAGRFLSPHLKRCQMAFAMSSANSLKLTLIIYKSQPLVELEAGPKCNQDEPI